MTEVSTDLVVPGTGEVVDLSDADAAAVAWTRLTDLARQVREAQFVVRSALLEHAATFGANTFRVEHAEVKVSRSDELSWDLGILRELRDEGLPDERWDELVQSTVDIKVNAVVARQIAKANPTYAAIVARAETRHPKNPTVSVALRAAPTEGGSA